MLKQRIITAIILVGLLLLALFGLSATYFSYVMLGILAFAAWEWADLSSLSKQWQRILYALLIVAITYFAGDYLRLFEQNLFKLPKMRLFRDVLGAAGIWWAVALLWVLSYPASKGLWGHKIARALMGVLVLVPSLLALFYVFQQSNGQWYFLYIVGIVICADVGAYFAGRKFGKKKLAPQVSPGKSWAGFWGGLACVAIYALLIGLFFQVMRLSFTQLICVTLIAASASVLGDLLESMVKRHRGIKDSSQLLPGHGGVMDRIDSLTAAAPVFVLLSILLAKQSLF